MTQQIQRVVWITGAGSGLGRALALKFVARGDFVVLSGRNEGELRTVETDIRKQGGQTEVILCDVRSEPSVTTAVQMLTSINRFPDILVNNAGITVFKTFLDTAVQEFDDIVQTNLKGPFLTTKSVLPTMLHRGNGLIINVISYAAKTTYTESSVYAASKAGVAALMEGLRAEVRSEGIKIVNVFPGAVLTPIWHPKVRSKYGEKMMSVESAARAIVDLTDQPSDVMIEEIVLRPQSGDITA